MSDLTELCKHLREYAMLYGGNRASDLMWLVGMAHAHGLDEAIDVAIEHNWTSQETMFVSRAFHVIAFAEAKAMRDAYRSWDERRP